jgi:hypothetical protein
MTGWIEARGQAGREGRVLVLVGCRANVYKRSSAAYGAPNKTHTAWQRQIQLAPGVQRWAVPAGPWRRLSWRAAEL